MKPYKIKRQRVTYKNRSARPKNPLKISLIVLGCVALFFVSFFAAKPLFDNKPKVKGSSTSIKASITKSSSSATSSRATIIDDFTQIKGLKTEFVGIDSITNSSKLKTIITNAKKDGYNSISFELKDETGIILYNTQIEKVLSGGVVLEKAFDLGKLIEQIKDAGLEPIGIIHSFKDSKATTFIPEGGVKLIEEKSWLWLDNDKAKGGKPWLNPFSDVAQGYITDIATEVASMGLKRVVLDSVQYPLSGGLHLAYFATSQTNDDKSKALVSFVNRVNDSLKPSGAVAYVKVSGTEIFGGGSGIYGLSPINLNAPGYFIDVRPEIFGASLSIDNNKINLPSTKPYDTVKLSSEKLLALLQKPICVIIGNITESTTKDNLANQIKGANDAKVDGYMVNLK